MGKYPLIYKHIPDGTNPRDVVGTLSAKEGTNLASTGMVRNLLRILNILRCCMAGETIQLLNGAQADNWNTSSLNLWKYTVAKFISDSCFRLDSADLSKIYILKAGIFRVTVYQEVTIDIATEGVSVAFLLNGAAQVGHGARGDVAVVNNDRKRVFQSVLLRCEAGQYLQVAFSKTAGVTGNIVASSNQGQLNIERIA